MIRFCCEQCGHKISVQDEHTGKRCKCQQCGSAIVVPQRSTIIRFRCESCGQKISVPRIHAGKEAKCPKCRGPVAIPKQAEHPQPGAKGGLVSFACSECDQEMQVPESSRGKIVECPHCGSYVDAPLEEIPAAKAQIVLEPRREERASDASDEEPQEPKSNEASEQSESTDKRKLPWFIDMLLYPTSRGGLTTLAVIILLKLLTDIAAVVLMCCICGGILGLILRIIVVWSYMYWYFSECIRDSADGGIRAPEILGSAQGLGDMVRLFACYALFYGPVTFYRGYTYFADLPMNNMIFLSLMIYGAFFFPMGVLAVVMFGSVNGLNPILIIRSIVSTFLQYCGLAILFYGLNVLFVIVISMMVVLLPQWGVFSHKFFTYILLNIFLVYALLIMGHILGRFYWRYQERLYWEV